MEEPSRPAGSGAEAALTELILDVFRLNGRLLAAGDRLVADLELTSARWQVLGAVALAVTPGPVAHLARSMGLTRQGVQRIVNALAAEGLLQFEPNPHHRRAPLVTLTEAGRQAYQAAIERQIPWVSRLAEGLDDQDVMAARRILRALVKRLEHG
jgi:DNA-binding MarR family transcriptional regulator